MFAIHPLLECLDQSVQPNVPLYYYNIFNTNKRSQKRWKFFGWFNRFWMEVYLSQQFAGLGTAEDFFRNFQNLLPSASEKTKKTSFLIFWQHNSNDISEKMVSLVRADRMELRSKVGVRSRDIVIKYNAICTQISF